MSPAFERSVLPIGKRDRKIDFPAGRNSKLPSIYVMKDHPLHIGSGTSYYFIHDGTMKGSEIVYNMEVNELKIPQGSREEAIAFGFLELLPGDIIFSRLTSASSDGLEDVAVMWVTGGNIFHPSLKSSALHARDKALGERVYRTRSHPILNPLTGTKHGGTTWERSLKGKFNERRGRCYPFGCTFQRQRALYSPCAAGKLTVIDESTLKMRTDLAEIITEMAMLSFKQGPASIVEAIRLNHELYNTPCVGSPDNFAYTSNQLNLSHMREWDSEETLADSMGPKFGAAHIDQLDSPGHFTNMVALSDIPDGCDPGRFFVVYPGVFCTLHNFVSVNFSGLRVHGGSPPIANRTTTRLELEWSTRCIGVSYAKSGPTTTEHKMPLVNIEPDKVLSVTPEMLRHGKMKIEKKTDATCFIVEGPTLMRSRAFMEFLGRCILLLVLAIVSELPSVLDARVDSDAFLGSFTYTDDNGVHRKIGPWKDGPGWRSVNVTHDETDIPADEYVSSLKDQSATVAARCQKWEEHQNKYGGHIPSAVCCVLNITPLEGHLKGKPVDKIKPLLFNKDKVTSPDDSDSCEEESLLCNDTMSKNRKKKRKERSKCANEPFTAAPRTVNTKDHIDPSTSRTLRSARSLKANQAANTNDNVNPSHPSTQPRLSARPSKSIGPARDRTQLDSNRSFSRTPAPDGHKSYAHESASSDEDIMSYLLGSEIDSSSEEDADVYSSSVVGHETPDDVIGPITAKPVYIPNLAASILKAVGRVPPRAESSHSTSEGFDGSIHIDRDHDMSSSTAWSMNEEHVAHVNDIGSDNLHKRQALIDDEYGDGVSIGGMNNDVHRDKRINSGFERLWNSTESRKLEIHFTTCEIHPRLHPRPASDTVIAAYDEMNDARIEKEDLSALPKYLRGITAEVVHNELQILQRDVMSLAAYNGSFDVSCTIDALFKFQNNVVTDPLNMTAVSSVQAAWAGLDVLEKYNKINTIRLRKVRACVMLTNSAAWAWLTITVPNAIRDIVYRSNVIECFWLSGIMDAIREAMLNRERNVIFHPLRFNITPEEIRVIGIDFDRYILPGDGDLEAWSRLYSAIVVQILETWLCYPVVGDSRWQGLYALNIMRTIGPEFLLLDVVWNDYLSANHRLMRSSSIPELLDTERYSLLNPASSLRLNVKQIAQFVNDYVEGRLYRYAKVDLDSGTSVQYASEAVITISEKRIVSFKTFVLDCFRFLFRGEEINNKRLQNLLVVNPDKYSPFREHTPTRMNMRTKPGPYVAPALQTLSGLFSALVCRGITFGTFFSRTGRTLFHSPEDFAQAIRECQSTTSRELVYCDPAAYGPRAIPKRNPNLINVYWERVLNHPWEGLTCTAPLSFRSTYEYFRPVSGSRFPELGNLGAYLITVDYVYAGIVLPPDAEELGRFICLIDTESTYALYHLGLVSGAAGHTEKGSKRSMSARINQSIQAEFASALSTANKIVKDSIPREYHAEAGLDVFVTEHSLCRFMQAHELCDLSK